MYRKIKIAENRRTRKHKKKCSSKKVRSQERTNDIGRRSSRGRKKVPREPKELFYLSRPPPPPTPLPACNTSSVVFATITLKYAQLSWTHKSITEKEKKAAFIYRYRNH